MEYFHKEIDKNEVTEPLIKEIEQYVHEILKGKIPEISYNTYVSFHKLGSRKEFEKAYFERRKQLTALGLYLQWNNSKEAIYYFKELLWTISNEFSWCLAPHLSYGDDEFLNEPRKIIDLFSAETAETLSEIITIHKDKLDKLLINHITKEIKERVIEPFINKNWEWETATHNWCAVCSGCIGITALLLTKGERQKLILKKVERALKYYIKGFGEDGATLEGIGYWSYGFGYYTYYKALRKEIFGEDNLGINEAEECKIKEIANFPHKIQISEKKFIPFSDVPPNMTLPSGLISYLYDNFSIKLPQIRRISSFHFDHCYRWAHVSRNLWWTSNEVLNKELKNESLYFNDAQWMINKKDKAFFAIKGGSNFEPHNHNDVGNFIIAIDGEIILSDLGAGEYTKEYFGSKRYTFHHTRSYWHSVPTIDNKEQAETTKKCKVIEYYIKEDYGELKLEISSAYPSAKISKFYRTAKFECSNNLVRIKDCILGENMISVNEGFISHIQPEILNSGEIIWRGKKGNLILCYDSNELDYLIESAEINNHYNKLITVYRLGLLWRRNNEEFNGEFNFLFDSI